MNTLRQIQLRTNLPFEVNKIIDVVEQLPRKGSWETMMIRRKDGSLRAGLRPFHDITHIAVHHTAVTGGNMHGHARYHISRGRPGIAYHMIIDKNQIYQVNDLLAFTWHTGNNNDHTVGICVEGDFSKRDLTDAERLNLYAAILTVMEIFNIPVENVLGHREYKQPTSCPVFDMNRVRKDIKNILMEIEYKKSAEYRAAKIVEFYARATQLYNMYMKKEQYWEDAERKLFTGASLFEDFELMSPTQAGKKYP